RFDWGGSLFQYHLTLFWITFIISNTDLPKYLYYPAFASLMLFLVLAFIPRQKIKRYFWFSLLWGAGMDIFLIFTICGILKLYRYEHLKPFGFYCVPIWIPLAWSASVMLFLHFLPKTKLKYPFYILLAGFSLISVFIGEVFAQLGLLREIHWHELLRFPVTFAWFYGATWHYQKLKLKDSQIFEE
ncbi:MAG: hypothetical protein K6U80_15410, partial [Firmicutes bacterium]|nr:hypothetical protein [Bacillota bacterium]